MRGNVFGHIDLALVLFAAVGVAAIHHQGGGQLGGFEFLAGGSHAFGVVVGRFATAQNHVAVLVALGLHDGDLAVLVHRQKVVATGRSLNRIGRDLDVAVGAVFEADGCRQARGQLAVHLTFGRSRTDGAPADEVANVLGRDHVQELAAGGHALAVDLDQQLACDAQTFVDAVALVQVRIVDQALPAHGGAGLFEVHTHHDFQCVSVFFSQRLQAAGVIQRRGRVVDRTRADDDEQSVVFAVHDFLNGFAGLGDQGFRCRAGNRKESDQMFWRWEHGDVLDAFVVGLACTVGGIRIPALRGSGFGVHRGLLKLKKGEKKPPGFGAPAVCIEIFGCLCARLSSAGD